MNWDAVGAIGELVGAGAVVATLVYLALQIRNAKAATADQSRLNRANAVQQLILKTMEDDSFRMLQMKALGMEDYYTRMAEESGITLEEATKLDFGYCYYFWMWWGQYSCTTEARDLDELEHIVSRLATMPGMKAHWINSPLSRPLVDSSYAKFVDGILAKGA